mmetsp:Transcript_13434/g.31713  ORF Transcript_13434/g.31713 Transcript_13434/m.31713 type:complete len:232 (+) Transcript_13434:68-763(+)
MLHPQPELQAATAGEEEDEAASAADAQMQGVNRAFATAKRAGVPAATRLMKELRRLCMNGSYEVSVNEDAPQPLLCWAVRLYEFNFDEDSTLAEDLAELSSRSGRDEPTPLCLCLKFPTDFPFSPPLVYVSTPQLLSGHVLDGALCMEMLVEWQPQYGNIEAMLVQICAFIGPSARVASLVPPAAGAAVAGASPGPSTPATAVEQETAAAAYEVLRGIHEKKGWAPPDKHG